MENGIIESKGAAISQAGAFNAGLMDDFISFIDRGEATTKTYTTNLRQFRAWMLYAAGARRHSAIQGMADSGA